MTATTNMDLTLGVVGAGGDTQETWGNIINENARIVDEHNHTSGAGVKIPSAGININADLSANNYQLTGLKTTAFTTEASALAASFKSCVYVVAGNLYFNNGAGSAVQVTTGSAVNVGSTGTISGMSGTASVAFNGTTSYAFARSSGVYADLAMSGCQIFYTTVGAANGLTLGVQANLPTAYSILFPIQTPNAAGGDIFPELDTSGNVTWKKSVVNDGTNTIGKVAYFSDAKTLSSIALGAGQLLIGTSTSTAPSAATLTGTANQLTVTTGSGSITLSLPQNIHSLATPTFAGLTLSGAFTLASTAVIAGAVTMSNLTASRAVVTDGSKVLASLEYTSSNTVNALVQRGASGEIAIAALTATSGNFSTALAVTGDLTCASSAYVNGAVLQVASKFRLADGSIALPALAFTADTDTGIFRNSTDSLGFSAGGVLVGSYSTTTWTLLAASITGNATVGGTFGVTDVATFTSGVVASSTLAVTGLASFGAAIRASNGTQAAPGISFTGSTGTGFYSSGAGVLSFASGGSAIGGWSAAGKFTFGASGGGEVHQVEGGLNVTTTLAVAAGVTLTSLNASQVVITDGSKQLSSIAYSVSNTVGALVQRNGSGDFNANTITLAGDLTATGSVTSNLVDTAAGISTGGNGSGSRIKWKVIAATTSGAGQAVPHGLSGVTTIISISGVFSLTSASAADWRVYRTGAVEFQPSQAIDTTNLYIDNATGFPAYSRILIQYT